MYVPEFISGADPWAGGNFGSLFISRKCQRRQDAETSDS